MYKWLIIGGGIHGTYISNYLTTKGFCESEDVAVLDPFDCPLKTWKQRAESTGMDYLRSPAEHNIDIGAGSLYKFARQNKYGKGHFHKRFRRPKLSLFNRHCENVIDKKNLSAMRIKGHANSIQKITSDGYLIGTDIGDVAAENVVLSLGTSECLNIPHWAEERLKSSRKIQHIFSPDFDKPDYKNDERIAVVGGGITAAQAALQFAKQRPGSVHLITYNILSSRELDFDPCWTTENYLNVFRKETDYRRRRDVVNQIRHNGSIPPSILKALRREIDAGNIQLILDSIVELSKTKSDELEVLLAGGTKKNFDYLCLATGFSEQAPGGELYEQVVAQAQVSTAPCGYPKPDKYLQVAKGLFVTGALAELELGPASRNIVGAKMAAEKIVRAKHKLKYKAPELKYYYFQSRRNN